MSQFSSTKISLGKGKVKKYQRRVILNLGNYALATGYENCEKTCEKCGLLISSSNYNGLKCTYGKYNKNHFGKLCCIDCAVKLPFRYPVPKKSDFEKFVKMVRESY